MNKEFNDQIEELKEAYEKDPNKVKKELRKALININLSNKIFKDIDIDIIVTTILIIITFLIGFLNIKSYGMYLFGIAFFLAGLFVGMKQKGFGLIFLLSHGVTGICIMIGSLLSNIINSPILEDSTPMVFIYLGLGIIIIIIGLILTVIHNLSDNLKEIKWFQNLILGLFNIAFFMSAIFPHIITNLNALNILRR